MIFPDIPMKAAGPSTGDLGRIMSHYDRHVRKHTLAEKQGVMSLLRRLITKGFTLEQIWQAVKYYEAHHTGKDQRFVKTMRGFFQASVIQMWQSPTPDGTRHVQTERQRHLEELAAANRPVPKATTDNESEWEGF